jgi:hypothetical protein
LELIRVELETLLGTAEELIGMMSFRLGFKGLLRMVGFVVKSQV